MLLILYSAAVVYWMFIGFGRVVHPDGPLQYNLEPLRTIKLYFDLDNGVPFSGTAGESAGKRRRVHSLWPPAAAAEEAA